MPQTLLINDFSAGWCPADDPVNGRKNGLLRMDQADLDKNGAIRMSGGSNLITDYSVTPGVDCHSLYTKFLATGQLRYFAFVDGSIYRGTTSIGTGGSATRAAFGAAFDFVFVCSGAKRVRDDGTTTTNLGVTKPSTKPTVAASGGGVLTGSYQYLQLNIVKAGAYVAKSGVGPTSDVVSPSTNAVNVTPDSFVAGQTEAWIFRKGGQLDDWYRVAVVTSAALFSDNLSDFDTLDSGILLDSISIVSVNSTDLPDDILEMVGLINGRMIYFTKNTINFSLTGSPDSYIPLQSIAFGGGATGAELFLFARKVADNIIIVSTTKDFYILTGTFRTNPDGTLDVYFRSLTVENPAISFVADVYNGSVVCMTAAGWKLTDIGGNQTKLTDTRVDRLYRGETIANYGGVPIYSIPQYRYDCAVIRDKLYVRVPQIVNNDPTHAFTYRMEAYDFKRNYWRALPGFNPSLIYGNEDDSLIGFYNVNHQLRSLDDPLYLLTNNGAMQSVNLRFSVFDMGKPRNRKDIYNIKFKINTAGSDYLVDVYGADGVTLLHEYTVNSATLVEVNLPVYAELAQLKNLQLNIAGTSTDFLLCDISIDYDVRPDQISNLILIGNLGGAGKKRIRTWPFKLDNLGTDVTCTPYVDGVAQSTSTFSAASYEKTFFHFFKTDVFGVDYKFKLTSSGLFELYEPLQPEIVETLPVASRFTQLGPIELFRYGQVKEFEIRVLPFGTTIPYTIYFEDGSSVASSIAVTNGIDQMAFVNIPKEVEGSILRIEVGPTDFDFHLWYGRVKVQKKGRDTEIEYLTIQPTVPELIK